MNINEFVASNFPLQAAPNEGAVSDSEANISYLAARDGLWRRVQLPWVRSILPVATSSHINVPYGALQPAVDLLVPAPDRELWRHFVSQAKAAMPHECASALLWNTESRTWRYATREPVSASVGHIVYREVDIGDNEILVVDIHSHGASPAFFSRTDDRDDNGSMKISVVFGSLDADLTLAARINLLDQRRKIDFDRQDQWSVVL